MSKPTDVADMLCTVCRRREAHGLVCGADRLRLAAMLTDLPGKVAALDHHLVPGVDPTERVTVTRVEAPAPARVDVLSLAGAGSEYLDWTPVSSALLPAVHRWTTRTVVVIERTVDGETVQEERTVVDWHQEPAAFDGHPVLVRVDDQVGVLPPRETLDAWARRFRRHFGHRLPARTRRVRRWPELGPVPPERPGRDQREATARAALGLRGYVPASARPDDPLAEEWTARFGRTPDDWAMAADVRYLLVWLDRACDDLPDIGAMAVELRSVSAELGRVLGDSPDQQWLGRCPATLVDRADNSRRPCGAGLWQDPYASQVQCPRCRSTWGPAVRQILDLAREILAVWPLDRRRRYTTIERRDLVPPRCAGCGRQLEVCWREVTTTTDRERWWRFVGVKCQAGCPDAGKGV